MCWLSRLMRRRAAPTVGERMFVLGVLTTSNLVPRPTVVRASDKGRRPALVHSARVPTAIAAPSTSKAGATMKLRGDPFAGLTRGGG